MPSDHDDSHLIEAVALAATVQQLQEDLDVERAARERAEQRLVTITEGVEAAAVEAEMLLGRGITVAWRLRDLLNTPTADAPPEEAIQFPYSGLYTGEE